jgi:hypothetical protein
MMKMSATTGGDSRMKAETGLHIQERAKEVFGAIDVTDFGKACKMTLDRVDPRRGQGGGPIATE